MSNSIRVSPSHGLNPSMLACFACSETYGIALLGKLPARREKARYGYWPDVVRDEDPEAPRVMRGGDLCDRCRKVVADGGVIFIEARDETTPDETRTGRMWAITGEAFDRIFNVPRPPKGISWIDTEAATKLFGPPAKEETSG